MIQSYNHQIITEPYTGATGIKSKITSGVSVVQQKSGVIGLKVLQDAVIDDKLTIKKGSTVFIKEEILHVNKNYSHPLECSKLNFSFVLMNFAHVAFVEGK
jgi:hypothetical protein